MGDCKEPLRGPRSIRTISSFLDGCLIGCLRTIQNMKNSRLQASPMSWLVMLSNIVFV